MSQPIRGMKCAFVACAAGLCGLAAHGQTVVNGSFEVSSGLPAISGQWNLLTGWTNAGSALSTPDFYHTGGSGAADLPETPVAQVLPFDGEAVAGLQITGAPGANVREYLVGSFSAPLTVGQRYRMAFAVTSGALTPFSLSGLKVSGLGVSLGTAPAVQTGSSPLTITPSFRINQPFFDPEWRQLSFEFVASVAYTHFTFGVFGPDEAIAFEPLPGSSPSFAYCFVDRFTLEPIEGQSLQSDSPSRGPGASGVSDGGPAVPGAEAQEWFVPNAFTPNGDGENDRFEPVVAPGLFLRFKVFNRWGQVVYDCTDRMASPSWDGKAPDGKPATDGSYFWTLDLQYPDGRFVQKQGSVMVLR
jgi:gliding motility-associated-like protein